MLLLGILFPLTTSLNIRYLIFKFIFLIIGSFQFFVNLGSKCERCQWKVSCCLFPVKFTHQVTTFFITLFKFVYLFKFFFSAASLWAIVQRTKLCLDFSATAYFLHLVASLIYNSAWPSTASWWVLQSSCITITCVLAEFLCMRSEMKSIPLGMSARVDL